MNKLALLGDEAVALGAIHAGISAAYGYPGTPSTEILEYLIAEYEKNNVSGTAGHLATDYLATWCANEKTAVEAGLGVSFAGRRAIITMKHVGLNVAADPFINAALLGIKGGLVIAVADDPSMHSSQNEQDSRFYASFAMIPCLEPRNQQEAYAFTREAFEVSERFHVPVLLRLTTRLSHARAEVTVSEAQAQNGVSKAEDRSRWMLLPNFARKNYADLVDKQKGIQAWAASHPANKLELDGHDTAFAVITSGLGGNYYEENLADFMQSRGGKPPARLHIGTCPIPTVSVQKLCETAEQLLIIEEGQPLIEEKLRGILPQTIAISGKLAGFGAAGFPKASSREATPDTFSQTQEVRPTGNVTILLPTPALPRTGELDPDNIRPALGLPPRANILDTLFQPSSAVTTGDPNLTLFPIANSSFPNRPPQLCQGCPHGDSYEAIKLAVVAIDGAPNHPTVAITSDIGCYSLGASLPYAVPETIVCMGASIGMARGASDAGIKHVVAVIGDSTFLHSGITGLIDAAASNTRMTVVILDNSIVAMTGCQETIVPSERLKPLILGLGVDPAHLVELEPKKQLAEENAAKLRVEIEYNGLSVVVFKRPCLEALR